MLLIVGLGNPGDKYRDNRHNIGFMAVDEIARQQGLPPFRSKFSGLITDGQIGDQRVLLLKPETFMNRSGDSVGAAASFYKIPADDVIIMHDELDLAPGKVRIKQGGGHGGHNGLRSIDPVIGKDYHRVRLGIGHPGHKDRVHAYVLGDFAKADATWRDALLDAIGKNAALLVRKDFAGFMNKLSLAVGAKNTAQKPQSPSGAAGGQSHIHKARQPDQASKPQPSGPMAAMLKKLFDKN